MCLRKSRADEELGYENTLERHEEMLRNLAAQTGIHVDESHIYREIVSGESIEARPQMQKLLKAVEMGLYTGVLCIELERLSRGDGADQQRILKAFQFSDTKIITLTKTYDLLKMIIDRIEYEKTESGAAIEPTLRISLKI